MTSLPPNGVLFTDLDGTLLDLETYLPTDSALTALKDLALRRVVTVPVTSKTAAEVEYLARGSVGPLRFAIVEGGAVLLEHMAAGSGDPGLRARLLGPGRGQLIAVLERLKKEGLKLRGLSEMSAHGLAEFTGLDEAAASRAMARQASEPFLVVAGHVPAIEELDLRAANHGASVTRGGRFWHLLGAGIDKGTGMRRLREHHAELGGVPSAGVGDAWNDLPMLAQVDVAFFLGSAVQDRDLPDRVVRIPQGGPEGFAVAAHRFAELLPELADRREGRR